MLLELSNDETRVLKDALDADLRTLLEEIAKADTRDFKEDLKRRYEQLEPLRRRLDLLVESDLLYT